MPRRPARGSHHDRRRRGAVAGPVNRIYMPNSEDKLTFDRQLLEIYLTGLQAEIEAKLRRVARFREQMQRIDAGHRHTDRKAREQAARALIKQVHDMLATNLLVRETLQELLAVSQAVLRDVQEPAK
jgi:hypothetical protein